MRLVYFPGNSSSSEQEENTIKLSPGIVNNPYLQRAILSNTENNPFLQQSKRNESQSRVVTNTVSPKENDLSSATVSLGNPVINVGNDLRSNTTLYNVPGSYTPPSVTQPPYRPPSYTPERNTLAPMTSKSARKIYLIIPFLIKLGRSLGIHYLTRLVCNRRNRNLVSKI